MAQHIPDSSFGSSIIYQDRLPLKAEYFPAEPESGEVLRVGLRNDDVLRMLMSMDESSSPVKHDDSERSADIQRLEFKVNLVLDMLGELYSQGVDFPDEAPIKLGAYSASWMLSENEAVPEVGQYVALHIYLNRRYPRPLMLFAQVCHIEVCGTGEKWVEVDLLSMPQQTLETLERFVFRQHRRFVAFSRRKEH